ncbi:MAG: helix-turn-helix domain-containing protein [Mucilaginibacter sp.]
MNVELITKEDLQQFGRELIEQVKQLAGGSRSPENQWLKSAEVRKLLKISPGTLQNLRINGTLRFTRIGSIMYYRLEDINSLL